MRRSPLARVLALAAGSWYAVLVAEPVPLHGCAMHGAMAGHAMSSRAADTPLTGVAHEMADMSQHDMTGMAMTGEGASGAPSTPAPAHQGCSCLGCGASASTTVLPDAPTLAVVAASARHGAPVRSASRDVEPRPSDRRLPLATAPPRALTI